MRLLLLLLALLPAVLPAQAQSIPTSPAPATVAPAAPDTAAAIHRLFKSRRRHRRFVAAGIAAAAFSGIGVLAAQPVVQGNGGGGSGFSPGGPPIEEAFTETGIVAVIISTAVAEIVLLGSWGSKREQRAIEAWQQHRLQPRIQRQLKPRFFRPVNSK